MKILLGIAIISFIAACGSDQSTSTPSSNPGFINVLIAQFQSAPVGNPPRSIYKYDYNGGTVYYIPPQCCDEFSTLLNAEGNVICAPDGGFSGNGDGRCTDFFQQRSNKVLIWSDSRNR